MNPMNKQTPTPTPSAFDRMFEPGFVVESQFMSEEEERRILNEIQAMHGATLTDLDGHPLDSGAL